MKKSSFIIDILLNKVCVPKVGFRLKLRLFVYLKSGSALRSALNACEIIHNKNNNNNFRFPGGGLGNKNPARTIAHSPPGVRETLIYMLREKDVKRY